VDTAVKENSVLAYLDDKYTKKITGIERIDESNLQFRVTLPLAYNPTGASKVSDSTFEIGQSLLSYNTSIANYQINFIKEGTPSFNLEGYGFGKVKTWDGEYTSIYYLKIDELNKILTTHELNFYTMVMEGSFVQKETKVKAETSTWSITTEPIGWTDILRLSYPLDTAMDNVFDTLFKLNLVPTTFASKDKDGKIHYKLGEKSIHSMKLNNKIKEEGIRIFPIVSVKGDNYKNAMLGWKLENSYTVGKSNVILVLMEEALFLDKELIFKYSPFLKSWEKLIF